MYQRMKIFILLFLCAFLPGCVGLMRANETVKAGADSCTELSSYCRFPLDPKSATYPNRPIPYPPSKAEVFEKFGKPDLISQREDVEVWRYNHDWAWRGIMPVLIIHIPLLIPVGYNHWEFGFKGETVVSIMMEKGAGGYCGLLMFRPVCY